MNKNLIVLATVLVVVLIGIWGFYLYNRNGNTLFRTGSPETSVDQSQNQKTPPQSAPATGDGASLNSEDDVIRFLEQTPPTTREQLRILYEGLDRVGKETDTITVTNCKNTPIVAKIKPQQSFQVVNNSDEDYKMRFVREDFVLPSGQSITLTVPAKNPTYSFYVMRCTKADQSPSNDDPIPGVVYAFPQ